MDNKEIFANNLKRLMDENGKTRNDVCDALGFNYYTFTDWVNGRKYPRIDKVEMLANYFGVKKSELIEERKESIEDELQRLHDDPELRAMLSAAKNLSSDDIKFVTAMIEKMRKE